jgi:hypothetical protein
MASENSIHLAAQLWCLDTTKNIEMIPELAEEIANLIDIYKDALIWCSGSDDFGIDGKARKGWLKVCKPLIDNNFDICSIMARNNIID